jgi:hypothetical protein
VKERLFHGGVIAAPRLPWLRHVQSYDDHDVDTHVRKRGRVGATEAAQCSFSAANEDNEEDNEDAASFVVEPRSFMVEGSLIQLART